MKAFEKGVTNHIFWKGFVFAVILSLLVSLFFTQDFAHAVSMICVIVVMLVIFKYSPILGKIQTPEQMRQRDAGFVYWMGMIGVIFFFLFILCLSVAILYFRETMFDSTAFGIGLWFILLSFIIVNCANFYFWKKTKSWLFWIFLLVLFLCFLGMGSEYFAYGGEKGHEIFTASFLVTIIVFLLGSIIYNLYIAMKYLVPYALPLKAKNSWERMHKA